MTIIDDPTLAVIARFVGDASRLDPSDPEFLRVQLDAIGAYVRRFPANERDARALEWIELNAERYRREWQMRAAVEVLARARCPDCPLSGGDEARPCTVHARWLALLQRYAADELTSHDYVEQTLELLRENKDLLKVGGRCGDARIPAEAALSAC
jgi:hypothetical protein